MCQRTETTAKGVHSQVEVQSWTSTPPPVWPLSLLTWLSWLRTKSVPLALALCLGAVYGATILPGAGYSPDTAEMQFSGPLLCVTHPTGYPTYLLLLYAFSRVVPIANPALCANVFSAVCSVLACLVLRRLLLRLGTREAVATATSLAFGVTLTFWRLSIVAEVYSLHVLFLALVAHGLLTWRQTRRRRDLILACALYALAFGNHLTAITVLPAFIFIVLATERRVVTDWRAMVPVVGIVILSALQYAYPWWRSLDPTTPYLSVTVTDAADLGRYATGAMFQGAMFAFSPAEVLLERIPLLARHWWADCTVLLPLGLLGLASFEDRRYRAFLILIALGHLTFALNYDISDIDVYFVPAYFVTAVLAGVGLERSLSLPWARRLHPALCLTLPLAFCLTHWTKVEAAKGADLAEPMRELLEDVKDGALIVARYNDSMYLLYFTLAEGLGGSSVFVAQDLSVEEIAAYLDRDQAVYLPPLRKWAPPGLPVYSTRLDLRPALRAAGLQVQMVRAGVFLISTGEGEPDQGESEGDAVAPPS